MANKVDRLIGRATATVGGQCRSTAMGLRVAIDMRNVDVEVAAKIFEVSRIERHTQQFSAGRFGRFDRNTRRDWPVDPRTGARVSNRQLNFLGIDCARVKDWMWRRAPLGMTPGQYERFVGTHLDALTRDGVDVGRVDIRLKGSSAQFFSSSKRVPAAAELAGNQTALALLREWHADVPNRIITQPFDFMHRLGLGPRSDLDVNISSQDMFDRVIAGWNDAVNDVSLLRDHRYLSNELVAAEFPHLQAWASEWSQSLGREVSHAVFDQPGPVNLLQQSGIYFRDLAFCERDWIIHGPLR